LEKWIAVPKVYSSFQSNLALSNYKEKKMTQKPALWLSLGLTVFTILILGGVFVATAASGGQTPASAAATDQLSPELAQLIAERELAYTQLIDQANQQLLQAQAAIAQQNPDPAVVSVAGSQISPEQAGQLASEVALGGALPTGLPELVNYEGAVAYEVPFSAGNIYLDASTGALLFNGTISLEPSPVTAEQAAQVAASYMGNNNVYRVDIVELYGMNVYRVKFTNSDVVFVDQFGQILLVRLAPAGSESEEHEGDDHGDEDHEEHDDD
jgi:uncharacterized membrane protein YkoI